MPPASCARAGKAFSTSGERATSTCRVIAPMVIVSAPALMPLSAGIPERSIKALGAESRCFMVGRSDMPPARGRISDPLANNAAASGTELGL